MLICLGAGKAPSQSLKKEEQGYPTRTGSYSLYELKVRRFSRHCLRLCFKFMLTNLRVVSVERGERLLLNPFEIKIMLDILV